MADEKKSDGTKLFQLEIVTPERSIFDGSVTSVSCQGTDGRFQVLHMHAPLLASLMTGVADVLTASGEHVLYAMAGGFAQVFHDRMLLLVETAERRDQIDANRAQAAKERAEKRLKDKTAGFDEIRAKASLTRAVNRLKVVGLS